MNGFNGSFQFLIKEQHTVSWDVLPEEQREAFRQSAGTEEGLKVYQLTVEAVPTAVRNEKQEDWEKIRRVYCELHVAKKCRARILAIAPQPEMAQMPRFIHKLASEKRRFFEMGKDVFKVEPTVLPELEGQEFVAMFNNRYAQWIFTDEHPNPVFRLTLCLDREPREKGWLNVSVRAVLKGKKSLKNSSLWRKAVKFVEEFA